MANTLQRNGIEPMAHMAQNNDVANYVNERGNYYLGIFSPLRNVTAAQEFISTELDVIGITESFNDFLVMIHLKTGWPLEDFLYVKEKVMIKRPKFEDLSPEAQAQWNERLVHDNAIYKFAKEQAEIRKANAPGFKEAYDKFLTMQKAHEKQSNPEIIYTVAMASGQVDASTVIAANKLALFELPLGSFSANSIMDGVRRIALERGLKNCDHGCSFPACLAATAASGEPTCEFCGGTSLVFEEKKLAINYCLAGREKEDRKTVLAILFREPLAWLYDLYTQHVSKGEALPEPLESIIMKGITDKSKIRGDFNSFLEISNGFMSRILQPNSQSLLESQHVLDRDIDIFGLSEMSAEFLAFLAVRMGWQTDQDITQLKDLLRQGSGDSETVDFAKFNPEKISEWKALISQDVALYDYVQSRFSYFTAQLPGFEDVLHRIQS